MGGDHKCPVCFATFTRPQHVARHMRSHTGDRPYKCQHCGDQFARSDLLSRHVKKCHANESLPRASNYRRKGTSSATRATTSKQACDQCVESLLPCDGANPCQKCIQRECQCTFVKFHRQTAPIGPGHNTSTRPAGSLTDDFLLTQQRSSGPRLSQTLFPLSSFLPQNVPSAFLDPTTSSAPAWLTSQGSSTDARRYSHSSSQFSNVSSSIPSSASSSSVHLPGGDIVMHHPAAYPIGSEAPPPPPGEGGFSSAFGLMSLDDPAVLAGEATDAQPFFWNIPDPTFPPPANLPSSRPQLLQRPSTSSSIPYAASFTPSSNRTPTASREAETRELREFWKAYLRTPLSGSLMSTPQAEQQQQHAQQHKLNTPTEGYKRQRVSSLPSVKTPGPSIHGTIEASSVRPTLHGNPDDLRSYEAAVLARKTPVNLHIVPKRKQTHSLQAKPLQIQPPSIARPGSSTGHSSSLANALGDSPSSSSASSFSRESSTF